MSMNVGELYYSLGIEDNTKADMAKARDALRKLEEKDTVVRVTAKADTSEVDRAEGELRSLESAYQSADLSTPAPIIPPADVSRVDDDAAVGEASLTDMIGGWAVAGAAAAAMVGAAIGKTLLDGLNGYLEAERDSDYLAAQLGLTESEAKVAGEAAAAAYKRGWGGSLGDVNDAIREAMKNGLIDESSTEAEIQRVAERLLLLQDVFGQDLGMAAQAVGRTLRNGLAPDAESAFDVLVRGLQGQADGAGDLLETYQEYGPIFKSLGLDGETSMGLLSQGMQGGARDADTLADAIKEFSIRGKDDVEGVRAAYERLGLDADVMMGAVAAGGPAAATAFGAVLEKLREVEDPIERNRLAVELFGTKAEDLQGSLFALDTSTAVSELGKVGGAAEDASVMVGDNLAGKWDVWKREAEMGIQGWIGGLIEGYEEGGLERVGEMLSEDIEQLGDLWDEHGPAIIEKVQAWWDETGQPLMGDLIGAALEAAGQAALDYMKDKLTDPNWWLDNLTMPMGALFQDGMQAQAETMANATVEWLKDMPSRISEAATGMWDGIYYGFSAVINGIIDGWNSLEFTIPKIEAFGVTVGGQTVGTPDIGWRMGGAPQTAFGGIGAAIGSAGSFMGSLPSFDGGGLVDAPIGQGVLALVHGQETIRTPEQERALQSQGMSIQADNHFHGITDPYAAAEIGSRRTAYLVSIAGAH